MKALLTGNEAAALAAKLANPEVVAAYPITPQTSIAEKLAEYAARGEMQTRYLNVESETSALAACIGGSLAGARVFTATSSQGLALMHELLHWASGARLPIVIVNVNRSMAAPWSLGVDHNDTLSQRDTGCLQIYCETAQEVLDTVLMAFKLAETVLLPILVCMDGFLLSHYSEPVETPDPEAVQRFLGKRRARYRMDPKAPCTFGGGVNSRELFRLRHQLQEDMDRGVAQFDRVSRLFNRHFGRRYHAVESNRTEASELALISNGTMTGTIKAYLKQRGFAKKVGLVKMRLFRPFPADALRRALQGFREAVVIDRNLSPGSGGIFAQEIKSALYGSRRALPLTGVIAGLGGVDVTPEDLDALVDRIRQGTRGATEPLWMMPA
jgi:pyruvate/2-oxoacid:ferredoxin oxidoreductase alpha subunit